MKRVIVVSVVTGFLFASLPPAFAARPLCYGKRATIVGNARNNVLRGTQRADVIVGRAGDDRIRAVAGGIVSVAAAATTGFQVATGPT